MKEKIKKVEKIMAKHDELFFILVFLLVISGYALDVETLVGDEVWNFQHIYKMYSGYKIYVDANVITTPMFHIIGVAFFKLFGANFLIFRIYNIFLCLMLFFGVYKIFKTLNVGKRKSWLYTIFIFIVENKIIATCANYNTLAMTFCVYGILIILNKEKFKNYILLESIFITLILLTKQNIGAFYCMGYVIYTCLNKKEIKNTLKIIGITGIFLTIFVLILYFNKVLEGFISYAILGLKEFSSRNRYVDIGYVLYMVFFTLFNSLALVFFKYKNKCKNEEQQKNIRIFASFSFVLILISYPIFNGAHIEYGILIEYILFLYIINIIFQNIRIKRENINVFILIVMSVYSINSIRYIINYNKDIIENEFDGNSVYFGTLFSEEDKNKIRKVTKFIQDSDKDVIDISSDAAIYMLPLKKNNGVFDLLLLGNLGKDGEKGIVNKIEKMENKIILVPREKNSWQDSDSVIDFVKNNFEYIGEIEDLLIYETR